jgi:hypothetical protein
MAANKLVITVAPQKDICPHGKIYPIKAVAIIAIYKIKPDNHIKSSASDDKLLLICKYTHKKKIEAPLL